jgi:cold shock CspA family protein
MVGIVKFWNPEKQFGFAVTEDGQEYYIAAAHIVRPPSRSGQLHWTNLEGKRIRFDRAETKSPDAWIRMLNDGTLRDEDGIDLRNPRPPRRLRTKPVAVNVVVIDPADPGGRS